MKLAFDVYEPSVQKPGLNPIVLLHSLLETKTTWKPIAQPLADLTGRKVFAYDTRHHGESPWIGEYSMDVLVDDLGCFLENHSLSKVILLGHSVGGKVAIVFTLKHPEKVERLIVEDIPVKNFKFKQNSMVPTSVSIVKQMCEEFKGITDRAKAEQYMRELAHRFIDGFRIHSEVVDTYDFKLLPIKWNGNFYQIDLNIDVVGDALYHERLQGHLSGRFSGDVLFLIGGSSQLRADKDPLIEVHFPNAVKVILQDAGHFIHQAFPKKFVQEVANFINDERSKEIGSKL